MGRTAVSGKQGHNAARTGTGEVGFQRRSTTSPDVELVATDPSSDGTECAECRAITKRSSGLCRNCDPTSKKNRAAASRSEDGGISSGSGQRDDLAAQIEQGVAALVSGDDWRRWLDVQSRFHSYSFGNTMLILMRRPDATKVAGYRKWQELGRQVNGGERSIQILAPVTKKVIDDETGEEIGRRTFFRSVSVFDIAQTDGEDLPTIVDRLEGDAPEEMVADLTAHASRLGASVSVVDPASDPAFVSSTCNGYAMRTDDGLRIVIRGGMSGAQEAKTLAHELGHVALGHLDDDDSTAGHRLRSDKELEAESFAYIVTNSWGVDSGDYSFGYTASWSGGDPKRVREAAERVSKAVKLYVRPPQHEETKAAA